MRRPRKGMPPTRAPTPARRRSRRHGPVAGEGRARRPWNEDEKTFTRPLVWMTLPHGFLHPRESDPVHVIGTRRGCPLAPVMHRQRGHLAALQLPARAALGA